MICVFCRSILGMNPKLCKSQLKASLLTLLFNFFVFSRLYLLYDIVSSVSVNEMPTPDAVFVIVTG